MDNPEIHFSQINTIFSTEPETKGFDLSAGTKWHYPENYPLREYQFSIVKTALYNNTLVCLPTGLGKTFIAAVIMFNYWRWYPQGKVVFLAPTRPLVTQQIHACHNIMGIASTETIELTGTIQQKNRQELWVKKRVIFATPQVFQNDLKCEIVPFDTIKCVVIDEAHKALGKHSYCESIRLLSERNKYFRILALSATPGNKIANVHDVIQNLRISRLELRDDSSPDIAPYINERKTEVLIVLLSKELLRFRDIYIEVMDPHFKMLIKYNVFKSGNTKDISKGRIFQIMQSFQASENRGSNYKVIMNTLSILLSMSHAYELMIRNGLRAFYNFYQNHSDKYWLAYEKKLLDLLEQVKSYLGTFPDIKPMPDGNIPEVPKNIVFGHTKFDKVKELLSKHFKAAGDENRNTRAIVFVEYRDSANEVYVLLLQLRPLIRPQIFVGQSGQKQKHQLQALEDFKNNKVNVLISTSVGEEGLDVGEVDLIICFDASQNSPTRLVQRMGRTGRKRDGRIVLLVTDGKEYQTLKSMMSKKDTMNNKVLNCSNIASSLYQESPHMVPPAITPQCHKITFVPQLKTPKVSKKGRKPAVEKKKPAVKTKTKIQKDIEIINILEKNQFSMQKFLKKPRLVSNKLDDSWSLQSDVLKDENFVEARNIKLLMDDRLGEEFLTLRALSLSKKIEKKEITFDMKYFPVCIPIEEDFLSNYVVPDTQTLECLDFLTEEVVRHRFAHNNDITANEDMNWTNNFSNENLNITQFDNFIYQSIIYQSTEEKTDSRFPSEDVFDNMDDFFEDVEIDKIDNPPNDVFVNTQSKSKNSHTSPNNTPNTEKAHATIFDGLFTDSSNESITECKGNDRNKDPENEFREENQGHSSTIFDHLFENSSEEENEEQNSIENCDVKNKDHQKYSQLDKKGWINVKSIKSQVSRTQNDSIDFNKNISFHDEAQTFTVQDSALQAMEQIRQMSLGRLSQRSSGITENSYVENNVMFQSKSQTRVIPDSDEDMFIDDFSSDTEFDAPQSNFTANIEETQITTTNEKIENLTANIEETQIKTENIKNNISTSKKVIITDDNFDDCFMDIPQVPEKSIKFEKVFQASHNSLDIHDMDTLLNNYKSSITKNASQTSNLSSAETLVHQKLSNDDDSGFQVNLSKGPKVQSHNSFSRNLSVYKQMKKTPSKTVFQITRQKICYSDDDDNDFVDCSKNTLQATKVLQIPSQISRSFSLEKPTSLKRTPTKFSNKINHKNSKFPVLEKEKSCVDNSSTVKNLDIYLDDDDTWDSDFESSSVTSKYFNESNSTVKSQDLTSQENKSCSNWFSIKKLKLIRKDQPLTSNPIRKPITSSSKPCKLLKKTGSSSNVENIDDRKKNINPTEDNPNKDGFVKPRTILSLKRNKERQSLSVSNSVKRQEEKKPNLNLFSNVPSTSSRRSRLVRKSKQRQKKKKKMKNDYLEHEAEVTMDVDTSDGSSGENSELDDDIADFVSYTQNIEEPDDMHAHYLRTTRSPERGNFVFKEVKNHVPHEMLFSQFCTQDANNTYINDSFCVEEIDEDEQDGSDSSHSITLLEDIEKILKKKSKKRRNNGYSEERKIKKRRAERGISGIHSDSSSEDELERMRKQIFEESMLLKHTN